ncbi:dnaJ homolog subfamily A member 3, mitochondrial-like [Sycon ciliatum]|uniref:dnaJ homolog subfamily A member 3, mitochondrial-like n=1 Tax=Sycon ciliatum TaxID=27933 RepID=UPI0020ADCA46|eukprot:scpid59152/ scgid28670/ DnaJ homolog subfamily A member 3, mitochondrial; DnaJ protein Tid-1; Hepatocellular carcinoma-associated antigen 57; Tumorous imaginal discs protein Tid56 homolog
MTCISQRLLLSARGTLFRTPLSETLSSTRAFHTQGGGLRKEDLYKTLDVQQNSSQNDIKKAYYKLARKYHPDANRDNPEAAKKFARVASAYETLGNAEKRQKYDMQGGPAGGFSSTMGGSSAGTAGKASGKPGARKPGEQDEQRAEEIFRAFQEQFGRNFDFADFAERYSYASNQIVQVHLTFVEAALGTEKELDLSFTGICHHCHGMRSEPGSETIMCPKCGGTGEVSLSTGFFNMRSTCTDCSGKGFLFTTACTVCFGQGHTNQQRKVVVPFPAGVSDGQTISVPVTGAGTFFVQLSVAGNNNLVREGYDVHSNVEISFAKAVRGGTVRVDGVSGLVDVVIPPGTQSHATLRLGGRGIKRLNAVGCGDHIIHVKILVPRRLTATQRELIDKLAEEEGAEEKAVEQPGFFRRLWDKLFVSFDPEKEKETNARRRHSTGG